MLPLVPCFAQAPQPHWNGVRQPKQSEFLRKEAIERHFESLQPRARQVDGAIPGARLLEAHRQRIQKLQARAQAHRVTLPSATAENATPPGIQLRPSLDTGELPTAVVAGDFNSDGHMDFVVANGLTSDLWLYLGEGDGTFQIPRIIPLSKGVAPVNITAADTRKNGTLDLIVAEADTSTIGILLGNGDGTFGYETEYALPEPPEAIVVDDFNHDGKPDIAAVMVTVADPGAHVPYLATLFGDGTGKFSTPVITNNWGFYSTAWNLASGDVNGDGLPDVLITGPGLENSAIYLNNGDGTFRAGATVMENDPFALLDGRLADVNGDGCLDAVIADALSNVWIAQGDCSGNFASVTGIPMGDSNAALKVADINGDGVPDLITSSLPAINPAFGSVAGNTLSVALGLGNGKFGVARNYVGTSQAYSIGIADFNGDGKPDFVTANNDTDTVTVYQNDGSGGFGFPQGVYAGVPGQGTINAPVSSPSFVDFNGDGKTDIFLLDEGYSGEYYATAFLNDGTGKFTGPISSDTGIATPGNWLGDYKLGNFRDAQHVDLLGIGQDQAFSFSTQFILFVSGNGDGTFAKATPVATTGADGILAIGDFNRDGKLDFVAVNGWDTHTLTSFMGNGDGTFHSLQSVAFSDSIGTSVGGTSALRAYTGDFNRDGKLDVLVFTSGNGYWTHASTVWELDGNGDGTFQAARQLFTDFQPFALADVNGDGYPDIARYDFMWPDASTQTSGPARFTTYLGQPDGTFVQSSSYAPYLGVPLSVQPFEQSGDPSSSSLVADLNGDGKPDEIALQVVDQGAQERYAQILMGNGDGTFTPTFDVFPFYLWEQPLYAHDLDGDGKSDLVNLIAGTSSLQVLKGGRAPAVQIALEDQVVSGNASCGWVFPNLAASSAQTVILSSSISGVQLPSSVTIPANQTSARFCYTLASNFDWHQVFDVNAQLGSDIATAYASSRYSLGFNVALSDVVPKLLYSGQSTGPVTVTVNASQGYNSTARLYCEGTLPGDSCQFATDTLSISPLSAATTTVTFVTAPNAVNNGNIHPFTVVVDDGNVIQRQSTTIMVSPLFLYGINGPVLMGVPGTASLGIAFIGIAPYTLSCSGLPAGASCSFSGTQKSYPSSTGMTMTVTTTAATPPGTYPVQVTVASGSQSVSESFSLEVINVSIQGPDAGKDWVVAGGRQDTTITVTSGATINSFLSISCSLDAGGSCFGTNVPISQTGQAATLTISVPAGTASGQHILTVTATNGTYSQSFAFPFYVADYTGTLSTSSLSLTRGTTGSVTATLDATKEFAATVTLACSGTTQVLCSFSPASTQLVGGTSQTVTITLGTSATASVPASNFRLNGLVSLATLIPLGIMCGLRRRKWKSWLVMLVTFALVLPAVSCSSGGASSNSGSGTGGGGTGGGSNSYSVTVTATIPTTSISKTLGVLNVTVNH